jgi:hypothetical protein
MHRLLMLVVVVASSALAPTPANMSAIGSDDVFHRQLWGSSPQKASGCRDPNTDDGYCKADKCNSETNCCDSSEAPSYGCRLMMRSCTDPHSSGPWYECTWFGCNWFCGQHHKVMYCSFCNHRTYFEPYPPVRDDCDNCGCGDMRCQ